MASKLKQSSQNAQNIEIQKTSFLQGQVENRDLNKSVLKRLMTTYKECIKCTFVDPLMKRFRKSEAPIFYNKPNSARQSKFDSLVNSGNC